MQSDNPKLAGFDRRAFAAALEQKRRAENLSVRALAALVAVTGKDVSMACGGHVVGVAKVHALIRWLDLPLDHFDIPPMTDATETTCYGRPNVEHFGNELGEEQRQRTIEYDVSWDIKWPEASA
ncbi:hypothetical protein LL06_00825 [Hoeflea sp. BAL378]|uniref:hypothetical protein n=1 Tax=Hoeflea sp. BAL378 TaxID=1547437 RepID=UPI00051434F5|nr:hypothetical protein [Hoeflea sp. BAL378]KGF71169.1 hypothetical protein LL06_00825 [Hoeflea sp. BAL378]